MSSKRIIQLPTRIDKRGNLSFIEAGNQIPFGIGGTYWTYGTPTDVMQHNAISTNQQQLIVALSGSLDVMLKEGNEEQIYTLNNPANGLYIDDATSYTIAHMCPNTVCLTMVSSTSVDANLAANQLPIYTINDCSLIKLPIVGNRVHANGLGAIPFAIGRIFYIYHIPNNEKRGMHTHTYCHEMLIAVNGSFDVELDDGISQKTITLHDPQYALHIPPGIWASQQYTSGAICLVLASHPYDVSGYINTYSNFIKYRSGGSPNL